MKRAKPRVRLFEGDAGHQAPDDLVEPPLAVAARVTGLQREPDVALLGEPDTARHHADHGVRLPVDGDGPPDDGGIAPYFRSHTP